jgi:hypothetical protein
VTLDRRGPADGSLGVVSDASSRDTTMSAIASADADAISRSDVVSFPTGRLAVRARRDLMSGVAYLRDLERPEIASLDAVHPAVSRIFFKRPSRN